MLNRKMTWISILAGIILIILIVIGWKWNKSNQEARDYSIVYLTSGEIYIGHFYTFPTALLKDAYILQNVNAKSADPKSKEKDISNVQLFPLSNAVWAPTELYLNWKNIIYYGPLDSNSVAAQGIRNKKGR